jgi:hypothetical protein
MINRTKLQLFLAIFWFVSAYLAAGALLPWEWAWRCAWLNLIIGMTGLLLVTWTKFGERMFYEGPKGDEDGMWQVGMLWAVPVVILFLAVVWWIARLVGLFD